MRVYEPDPQKKSIQSILQELYLLRQAIGYDSVTTDIKLDMLDRIVAMVRNMEEA
jgi:hypothetical protein